MPEDVCVIIAAQRSGSTALGRAFGNTPHARHMGEIFHHVRGPADHDDYQKLLLVPEANYFTFREAAVRKYPELSFPLERHQRTLWRGYLDHVRRLAPGRLVVLDVKYNSTHHLDGVWRHPFEPAGLFAILRETGMPVVHMRRRNLLAQAISDLAARDSGRWHRRGDDERHEGPPAVYDPGDLRRQVLSRASHVRSIARSLQEHPRRLDLDYEDVFSNTGQIAEAARARLGSFLGRDMSAMRPDLKKVGPTRPCDAIANADEVLEAFAGDRLYETVRAWLDG